MVGIYVRVSTEEQAKNGFSLSDQIRECRKRAGTNEVYEYIDEGVSGEFLDRPALSRLRQDIRNGVIDKVICFDPDRLSRKLMNQLIITDEFDKRGVALVFVNGEYARTPEGNLFYSLRGAIAEFEKAKINERMSRGRKEKARQGRVLRDFRIYGYDYDKTNEQLVINNFEAKIVQLVFSLFTEPNDKVDGINGIAKYLTGLGIPTKRGASVWHRQVVRQMLANRAYIGEFYQNRWNTEGMLANKHKPPQERRPILTRPQEEWLRLPCPAIVDLETFNHAGQLLQESRRRWAGRSIHQYLLSGLVRCGECGNTMTGRQTKQRGSAAYQYTDRKNTMGTKHLGCGRSIPCDQLDESVWQTVHKWLSDENEIAAFPIEKEVPTDEQIELNLLEKELARTATARTRLLRLLAEESDLAEDITQSLHEMKQKEARIRERLAELRSEKEMCRAQHSGELSLNQAVTYYLGAETEQLSFVDKRELLRRVIREIRVYEQKVEIYTF